MSQTGVVSWSQTAATNANADATVNMAEGMAPSAVNDSARAMMASIAKYRDDISGAIVTGGTSTAYTVSSYQVFSSLSVLANQVIAFTPHTTSGATVTLNVDSLGAKPLRSAPSIELPAGTLVQGTPYLAVYNASDQAFYLQGFFGNPYGIMIGGSVDFWGSTAPNSSFVLMYGQAISRTTYSALFTLFSTQYGSGDGSTTFNIPDCRGRVIAGSDAMGGSGAGRLNTAGGMSGTAIGSTGGVQTTTLITANLPPYTPSGTISGSLNNLNVAMRSSSATGGDIANSVSQGNSAGTDKGQQNLTVTGSTISASFSGSAQGGTSTAFSNVMPTIVSNKLLRII